MSLGTSPTPLDAILHDRLDQADGQLPFAEVMELCLYHPEHGYYADPGFTTGKEGDFATVADTGPLFGATLAEPVASFALEGPCRLVEVGPGAGRMMADLLDHLDAQAKEQLEITLVEPFEVHHQRLEASLAEHEVPIEIVEDLAQVPSGRAFVVMNEVLDALPCHPVRRTEAGLEQMRVQLDPGGTGGFAPTWGPCPDEVTAFCREHAAGLPVDHRYEASLATRGLLDDLAALVERGLVLAFDYGGRFEDIWPAKHDGTLRGYRGHRHAEPLQHPGQTDITYDVDFTMVQAEASQRGLPTAAYGAQERLLVHMGLMETARSLGNLRAAKDLLMPGGFGARFQGLVLSRRGGAADAGLKVDLQDPQVWMRGARGMMD